MREERKMGWILFLGGLGMVGTVLELWTWGELAGHDGWLMIAAVAVMASGAVMLRVDNWRGT